MSKTPVMLLQEIGVKECVIPSYDIISQNSTYLNGFTFRVRYKDLCADGTASNKKEAKQNAAQNMLKLLQQSNISSKRLQILMSAQSNVINLNARNPMLEELNSLNCIGILQEYCIKKGLVQPVYELREINGPSHERKFTMVCTLGSITEEAVAATKKQAKQQAAQKVLHNLPGFDNIKINSQREPLNDSSNKKTSQEILEDLGLQIVKLKVIDDSVPSTDIKLKFLNATVEKQFKSLLNLNDKVSLECYHLNFKSTIFNKVCNGQKTELDLLYENFKAHVKRYESMEKHNESNLFAYNKILAYVKERFNLTIEKISLKSTVSNIIIIGFRVNSLVPLAQFGISENAISAEMIAVSKIIETFTIYLK